MADISDGSTRYWARFPDEWSPENYDWRREDDGWIQEDDEWSWQNRAEPPFTVIRRLTDGENTWAESFRVWRGWAPTQVLYDASDPRPSTPPCLVEIDAAQADRVIANRFHVEGATRQREPVIRTRELERLEAEAVAVHAELAAGTAERTAVVLGELAAAVGARLATEFEAVKSHAALTRQFAVLRSEHAPVSVLRAINDTVRFTVVAGFETYADDVRLLVDGLADRGYNVQPGTESNTWKSPGYKDFHAVWTEPGSAVRIEIQFHTEQSLAAREATRHLHAHIREGELWPRGTHVESAAFVRQSSWWAADTTSAHEDAVATLLGFDSIEEVMRDASAGPYRLAYLLDLKTGDRPGLYLLLRVIGDFVRARPVGPITSRDALDAVVDALTRAAALACGGDSAAVVAGAMRLLLCHLLLARGDLDGRPATPPRPLGFDGRDKGAVVATVLGLPNVDAMRQDPEMAAVRLAMLTDTPVRNGEACLVLATLLETFVERAYVPALGGVEDLVEETDRVAGTATPLEPALYAAAATGFGVPDFLEDSAGVYGVCSRVARFLFKSVLIRSM